MPPDPSSRHAHLRVRELTCYYHPVTILLPPQLQILYETLSGTLLKTIIIFKNMCVRARRMGRKQYDFVYVMSYDIFWSSCL